MKILIVSDSHGRSDRLRRLLRLHRDADIALFLGDGLDDFDEAARDCASMCICVRGNCDGYGLFRGLPTAKTEQLPLCGHRLMLTHGDIYQVKYGDSGIIGTTKKKLDFSRVVTVNSVLL